MRIRKENNQSTNDDTHQKTNDRNQIGNSDNGTDQREIRNADHHQTNIRKSSDNHGIRNLTFDISAEILIGKTCALGNETVFFRIQKRTEDLFHLRMQFFFCKNKINGKNDNNKQEPILQLSNSVMSDDNSDSLQRNVTKEQIKKTGSDKYQTNQQLKQNKKIKNKY